MIGSVIEPHENELASEQHGGEVDDRPARGFEVARVPRELGSDSSERLFAVDGGEERCAALVELELALAAPLFP